MLLTKKRIFGIVPLRPKGRGIIPLHSTIKVYGIITKYNENDEILDLEIRVELKEEPFLFPSMEKS
jgi:hypothetical protein